MGARSESSERLMRAWYRKRTSRPTCCFILSANADLLLLEFSLSFNRTCNIDILCCVLNNGYLAYLKLHLVKILSELPYSRIYEDIFFHRNKYPVSNYISKQHLNLILKSFYQLSIVDNHYLLIK